MRKLIIAFLLFSGFIFAQGPNSTGKIRYDKKAELIKQLHDDYANNNFELFETILAGDATIYLGSTQKYTKKQLIEGFKSHHVFDTAMALSFWQNLRSILIEADG